jgi:hypothetical protein
LIVAFVAFLHDDVLLALVYVGHHPVLPGHREWHARQKHGTIEGPMKALLPVIPVRPNGIPDIRRGPLGTAIARSNAVGVAANAPHPNAALLFYEYLLGEEAQQYSVSMDYVPSNTKVASPLQGVKILQTDPVRALDEIDTWTRLFNETLLKRAGR